MRKRKEIKKSGRHDMRRNFINCVIISFLAAFLFGAVTISANINANASMVSQIAEETNSKPVMNFMDKLGDLKQKVVNATSIGDLSSRGAISEIYHQSQKSGSIIFAIADGISKGVFNGRFGHFFAAGLGLLLTLLFFIFIQGVFRIGVSRFYLENRLYEETHISQTLFVFRVKRVWHVGCIVAAKLLFLVLWSFTIVGLPIKLYSYYMVPFITAENPTIKIMDAIKLSKTMMRGHKWEMFKFDISFLPWFLLSIPTFGLLQYIYITPYYNAAKAEYYMEIRKEAKSKNLSMSEEFVDVYLEEIPSEELTQKKQEGNEDRNKLQYPYPLYPIKDLKLRPWLHYDYKIRYTILNLILIFFIFSFVGWVYECILESIKHGMFINRGTLYGPWVPIYGVGGVAVLLLLRKLFDKPVAVFFSSLVICGTIEYIGALLCEYFKGASYWDYSGYFFNIQGRVCLEGLIVFAIGSCAAIYTLAPLTNNLLEKIPLPVRRVICGILIAAFGADFVAAKIYPRSGYGLTYGGQ